MCGILISMEQQQYKLVDAAKILGISPWTLRRWVYAGTVPAIKRNTGRVYIPIQWIKEQLAPNYTLQKKSA